MSNYKPEDLDKFFKQAKELLIDPQNKLRAIDLRDFLDKLYLREGEISKLDLVEVNKSIGGLRDRISHIEECLGIDFDLDKAEPAKDVVDYIDYCFIQDKLMREKVTAYYREMLRYKYGTRNHKICFGEFCRLAIIQVEFMLNYFFTNESHYMLLDNEISKIAQKIATSNFNVAHKNWKESGMHGTEPLEPTENDIKQIKDNLNNNKERTVSSNIPLSRKKDIFINEFNLKTNIVNNTRFDFIFSWICDMRNRKSHGSQSSIDPYEESYLTEEEKMNLEKWDKYLLDYFETEYNKSSKNKIHFKYFKRVGWIYTSLPLKQQEIFKQFQPLQWVSEKPYNDVLQVLRIVASTCAKELKKSR